MEITFTKTVTISIEKAALPDLIGWAAQHAEEAAKLATALKELARRAKQIDSKEKPSDSQRRTRKDIAMVFSLLTRMRSMLPQQS